ncbi:hypothetical protein AOLI_G00142770 [Acnodon oligacanthus]
MCAQFLPGHAAHCLRETSESRHSHSARPVQGTGNRLGLSRVRRDKPSRPGAAAPRSDRADRNPARPHCLCLRITNEPRPLHWWPARLLAPPLAARLKRRSAIGQSGRRGVRGRTPLVG